MEKMLTNWMSICLYSFLKVDVTLGGGRGGVSLTPLTRLTLARLSVRRWQGSLFTCSTEPSSIRWTRARWTR